MPTFHGLLKGVCAIYVPLLSHWMNFKHCFSWVRAVRAYGSVIGIYLAQAQGGKKTGRVPTDETKARLMLRKKWVQTSSTYCKK
jgi:hypothetical protein